ncbi:uncharacterized protein LOC128413387 [Podarcis raffonei]|uniref:uncharacterized protein LOC128413387 n=1 Tax=Podarcis raffonei TaxID=65483 RepID=UPI0023295902|nr:uncharacterized protein LOC128413387 [Podarcis raffonei]
MSGQGNQVNSTASGGPQGNQEEPQPFVIPSNPQALAEFFTAFQDFYRHRSSGQVAATPAAPVAGAPLAPVPAPPAPAVAVSVPEVPRAFTQDFIPETQPNEVQLPGTSAATVAALRAAKESTPRPKRNTRAQSAAPGKAKGGQRGGKKGKACVHCPGATNLQKDPGVPSLFQNPPPQAAPVEVASSSSSDEEAQGPRAAQAITVPDQAMPEGQPGKRKEKRKHTSKKSKKSRHSDSEHDSDGPLPLVSTGCRAAASAVPGTSVESRGPEAWGPESWEPEVIQGVMASLAPSTLRSYKKAWSDFLKFRNKTPAIRNNAPPVKPEVLSYLVYLRRLGRAPRTLNLQAAAISFFCKAVFSTDPCDDFVIRRTLEGWRRLQPPNCDMRRPISFDILSQIHKKLRTVCWSKYEARLFSAAYSIAFFGALRVGEVVYEVGRHGFSRGLLLSDVTLSREDLVIRIRSSKTDQYGRGALVQLMATDSPGPCPVKDTRRFLSLRANSAGPLLIHADGLPLTRHQFTRVMRLALAACGIPAADFASHSFRIGAATTAMHLGLTTERIRDLGRWKSDAYKRYLRKNL